MCKRCANGNVPRTLGFKYVAAHTNDDKIRTCLNENQFCIDTERSLGFFDSTIIGTSRSYFDHYYKRAQSLIIYQNNSIRVNSPQTYWVRKPPSTKPFLISRMYNIPGASFRWSKTTTPDECSAELNNVGILYTRKDNYLTFSYSTNTAIQIFKELKTGETSSEIGVSNVALNKTLEIYLGIDGEVKGVFTFTADTVTLTLIHPDKTTTYNFPLIDVPENPNAAEVTLERPGVLYSVVVSALLEQKWNMISSSHVKLSVSRVLNPSSNITSYYLTITNLSRQPQSLFYPLEKNESFSAGGKSMSSSRLDMDETSPREFRIVQKGVAAGQPEKVRFSCPNPPNAAAAAVALQPQ